VASAVAVAGDYPGNPDQRASIGVSLGLASDSGDVTVTSGGLSAKQDVSAGFAELEFDTRIPVSNNWTLSGALSFSGVNVEADETAALPGAEQQTGGVGIRVGARYYFGK
jgi:hypothetical protein